MKTTISTLLATVVITFAASAAPSLVVETTITEHHAKGGKDVLTVPRLTVESGKQATIQFGKLEYDMTPTLLDDGTVDIRVVSTERNGKKADKLTTPRITTKLGQVAEIKIGHVALTTKTSLAK